MLLASPLATSVRFHCPMQGPQALASTVPPTCTPQRGARAGSAGLHALSCQACCTVHVGPTNRPHKVTPQTAPQSAPTNRRQKNAPSCPHLEEDLGQAVALNGGADLLAAGGDGEGHLGLDACTRPRHHDRSRAAAHPSCQCAAKPHAWWHDRHALAPPPQKTSASPAPAAHPLPGPGVPRWPRAACPRRSCWCSCQSGRPSARWASRWTSAHLQQQQQQGSARADVACCWTQGCFVGRRVVLWLRAPVGWRDGMVCTFTPLMHGCATPACTRQVCGTGTPPPGCVRARSPANLLSGWARSGVKGPFTWGSSSLRLISMTRSYSAPASADRCSLQGSGRKGGIRGWGVKGKEGGQLLAVGMAPHSVQ